MEATKLARENVKANHPKFDARCEKHRKRCLKIVKEECADESEYEAYVAEYLETFWEIGPYIYYNVWADNGRFNEPCVVLHVPSGRVYDLENEYTSKILEAFWDLYMG